MNGVKIDYFKIGYFYIKCCVMDLNVIVGFEKFGYYFFNSFIGCGYDDGLVFVIVILDMLDCNLDKMMVDLCRDLFKIWGLLIMLFKCVDEVKYGVVDNVVVWFKDM